ncbi:MAG: RNA polymerase sigma factor [Planctomycetaceae bacterium]|jgi:RNA polymerase sigma-70 factor (ECF subfamily)|nr:RNA polymerase sigma factor [Planctomycetaceae bacterium]
MNYAIKTNNRCFSYNADQRTNINIEEPIRLTVHPCLNTMPTDLNHKNKSETNNVTKNTTNTTKNRIATHVVDCIVNNEPTNDYSKRSDESLLLDFREIRQRELFEELVKRYEHDLFNYIRRYVGDLESTEDVFQLTFMQVYLKCEQFESGRKFRPWLYAIATNKSIDLLRVRRRCRKRFRLISIDDSGENETGMSISDTVESKLPDPLSNTINDEEARRVRNAMERLPENLRQTLYLVYFQGLPYREAAEILGIPFGTIKSRLNQAINKLNSLLSK